MGKDLEKALQISIKHTRGAAIRIIEEKVLGALTEEGVRKEQIAIEQAKQLQEAQVGTWEDEELVEDDGLVDEGDVHVSPVPRKPITEV